MAIYILDRIILGIIYSVHKNLPPIYLCSSVELLFMLILICMKVYYEKCENNVDVENP